MALCCMYCCGIGPCATGGLAAARSVGRRRTGRRGSRRRRRPLLGCALELLHPVLQVGQRLLLHQHRLGHVVGCGRHGRDLLADVRLGLGIPLRRLLVDLPQLGEQPVDHLPLVLIHAFVPKRLVRPF